MIYLASPYSDPDPAVRQARYEQALAAVGWLVGQRIHVYSPILHFHNVALKHDLPKDADFWSGPNLNMLSRCDDFALFIIPGWKESKGCMEEVLLALRTHKFMMRLHTDPYKLVKWREEPPTAA